MSTFINSLTENFIINYLPLCQPIRLPNMGGKGGRGQQQYRVSFIHTCNFVPVYEPKKMP